MSDAATWADHACRFCMGRLLARTSGGRTTYECGACGITAQVDPHGICGCGILPRPVRANAGPRFRCTANPDRGVASPAAIVIAFDEAAP